MKKKACKTALYCKTKETAETGGKCFIGAHTQNIDTLTYNYSNVTQHKTKARKALIDKGKGMF